MISQWEFESGSKWFASHEEYDSNEGMRMGMISFADDADLSYGSIAMYSQTLRSKLETAYLKIPSLAMHEKLT